MTGTTDMAPVTSGTAQPGAAPPAPSAPLWRNRDYQLVMAGGAGSWIGLAMIDVVYPLLILGFTGSPMLAAGFGIVQFIAMILGSLPAGTLIDRHDRRRVLLGAETARALAAASLALTIGLGHLWLIQLYLVAAVLGVCQPFGAARTILLRAVVPPDKLSRALAQQQVRTSAASLIGPAIGTALYAAGRSTPFAASAAALALSAITVLLIRYRSAGESGRTGEPGNAGPAGAAGQAGAAVGVFESGEAAVEPEIHAAPTYPAPTDAAAIPHQSSALAIPDGSGRGASGHESLGSDGSDLSNTGADGGHRSDPETAADNDSLTGLRILWRRPLMRSAMLIIMVVNLIGVPIDLIMIVQARREGVPTHYIGLILAAFAAGAILGAPLTPSLHRMLSPGRLLIGFVGVVALTLALLAVPLGGFWMAGVLALVGLTMPALEILMQVLILQQVPDHQRGRVMSAAMLLMSLGMPLGSALGGVLLQLFSATGALLVFAAVTGAATILAAAQKSLRTAAWPEPTPTPTAAPEPTPAVSAR